MLREDTRRRASRLVALLFFMALAGEAGHQVFDLLGLDLAHHFFHIAFPLIAFVAFGAIVARDVRRHGWPTFSWRLSATTRGGSK